MLTEEFGNSAAPSDPRGSVHSDAAYDQGNEDGYEQGGNLYDKPNTHQVDAVLTEEFGNSAAPSDPRGSVHSDAAYDQGNEDGYEQGGNLYDEPSTHQVDAVQTDEFGNLAVPSKPRDSVHMEVAGSAAEYDDTPFGDDDAQYEQQLYGSDAEDEGAMYEDDGDGFPDMPDLPETAGDFAQRAQETDSVLSEVAGSASEYNDTPFGDDTVQFENEHEHQYQHQDEHQYHHHQPLYGRNAHNDDDGGFPDMPDLPEIDGDIAQRSQEAGFVTNSSDLGSAVPPTDGYEMAREMAAVAVVQRAARRFLARRQAEQALFDTVLASAAEEDRRENSLRIRFAVKIQAVFRGFLGRKSAEDKGFSRVLELESDSKLSAATKIQAVFRGHQARKRVEIEAFAVLQSTDESFRGSNAVALRAAAAAQETIALRAAAAAQENEQSATEIRSIEARANAELKAAQVQAEARLINARAEAEAIRLVAEARAVSMHHGHPQQPAANAPMAPGVSWPHSAPGPFSFPPQHPGWGSAAGMMNYHPSMYPGFAQPVPQQQQQQQHAWLNQTPMRPPISSPLSPASPTSPPSALSSLPPWLSNQAPSPPKEFDPMFVHDIDYNEEEIMLDDDDDYY